MANPEAYGHEACQGPVGTGTGQPSYLEWRVGLGRIEKCHAKEFELDFLLLDKRGW